MAGRGAPVASRQPAAGGVGGASTGSGRGLLPRLRARDGGLELTVDGRAQRPDAAVHGQEEDGGPVARGCGRGRGLRLGRVGQAALLLALLEQPQHPPVDEPVEAPVGGVESVLDSCHPLAVPVPADVLPVVGEHGRDEQCRGAGRGQHRERQRGRAAAAGALFAAATPNTQDFSALFFLMCGPSTCVNILNLQSLNLH